jgi:hypothetical protein
MKFALLIYGDESSWGALSDEGRAQMYAEHEIFGKWLADKGYDRGGEELHPSGRAKTVRTDGDAFTVSDGPFAETKEQLGGVYLIEAPSMDEAVEAARRLPAQIVEVRQIVEAEERPS